MSFPVKFFHSAMGGAPALNGTAGQLLALLDGCLVNGFNPQTLTSLTVTANVATANKTAHGFVLNQIVLISGATPAGLNGEQRITGVGADAFTFTTSGISDQTATGTITAKAAPAGWEKQFSGTNLAAYCSLTFGSNKPVLRVDDAGTTTARVVGYESMSDINTGSGPFPTAAQVASGAYWMKSGTADATARAWTLVADGQGVWFIRTHHASGYISFDAFTEFASEKAGDLYNAYLTGCSATTLLTAQGLWYPCSASGSASVGAWMPRTYTQLGTAIAAGACLPHVAGTNGYSGANNTGLAYPSPVTNGLIFSRAAMRESGGPVRCNAMPGLLTTPQQLPLSHLDVVTSVPDIGNRDVLIVACENSNLGGRVGFDLTGPWR